MIIHRQSQPTQPPTANTLMTTILDQYVPRLFWLSHIYRRMVYLVVIGNCYNCYDHGQSFMLFDATCEHGDLARPDAPHFFEGLKRSVTVDTQSCGFPVAIAYITSCTFHLAF